MLQVQGFCNWVIIVYDGSKDFENDICSKIKANPHFKVLACKRSSYALNDGGVATTIAPLEELKTAVNSMSTPKEIIENTIAIQNSDSLS
jgi:hypothetical protein